MKALQNGCSCSDIKVIPTNWKTQKASVKRNWKIYYRYYDPACKGTRLWGKLIPCKGMNRYKTLEERQVITAGLIADTEMKLSQGFNPITQIYATEESARLTSEIDPTTRFVPALKAAIAKLDVVQIVSDDMLSIAEKLHEASEKLFDTRLHRKYSDLFISQIQSRHLIYLFEQCGKDNAKFSAKRQNRYKAYLSMIFNQLISLQCMTVNPCESIETKKTVVAKKEVLEGDETTTVDKYLFKKNYFFWRYMQIFFHSGSRNTEMLHLKKDAKVRLDKNRFTLVVKKGQNYKEDTRVISKEVMHLWKEVWDEAEAGQYLFSRDFKPGNIQLNRCTPTRNWQQLVKKDLGINKDFYALKHLHSDIVASKLSLKHAQVVDGHTSETTTLIYAVNEKERQLQQVQELEVKFAG